MFPLSLPLELYIYLCITSIYMYIILSLLSSPKYWSTVTLSPVKARELPPIPLKYSLTRFQPFLDHSPLFNLHTIVPGSLTHTYLRSFQNPQPPFASSKLLHVCPWTWTCPDPHRRCFDSPSWCENKETSTCTGSSKSSTSFHDFRLQFHWVFCSCREEKNELNHQWNIRIPNHYALEENSKF